MATTTTCFTASITQTYKRRSRKERLEAQQKLEQHEEQKLLQKRDLKAKQRRKQLELKKTNIAFQLYNRELTGRRTAVKCAKPNHFSPVDSLLTLYQKKLKGNALSRLSVLTKGDKTLEKDLLEGNLCLLGYPKGNQTHQLPMIGFRINEQEDLMNELQDDAWRSNLWRKSIDLCFMDIFYHSVSYEIPSNTTNTTNTIQRSNSFSTQKQSKKTPAAPIARSKSVTGGEKKQQTIKITKPIALLRTFTTIRCCNVGIDIHRLCVHQSEDSEFFFVYNGVKERKKAPVRPKKVKRSTLPNSHAAKLSSFVQGYSGHDSSTNDFDLSHYQEDSLDIPSFSLLSPDGNNEEESDSYVCIVPSPMTLDSNTPTCASLFISFPCAPSVDAFDPKFCVYDVKEHSSWLLLNLRHCLYRVKVSYDQGDHYIPDEIESQNDSVSFSYFPATGEHSATFLHPRNMDSFDVDRYLYKLINQYAPHLSRAFIQFSTVILSKITETSVMIQLLYYARMASAQHKDDNDSVRGGFLLTFDIVTGEHEILHHLAPRSFTNVETVYEWAARMADASCAMLRKPHPSYKPTYTWDNSAYLHSTPMKLLAHPSFPFVLVNDLIHQV